MHVALLLLLSFFGLHRLSTVIRWFKYRDSEIEQPTPLGELPSITVQIPLYNERMVAERIVDTVVKFDYPADKLQIQIVDDSNDETEQLVADRVAFHRAKGIDISHVRRDNRVGYKAGALKHAMEQATGEFIAIFDADFVPHPSLLAETINYFSDPKLGMLQFRWEHLNRMSSRMTEAQAMMLDSHFALEQQLRFKSGLLLNFNGTAGIWRKSAIIDAGNWSADTLTEDLDLSYRAQLRGWKMGYLNHVACHGEIPADMNAFKSQQHRWAKGGIQVMLKLLKPVWRSSLPLKTKIESTFHFGNNLAYLVMLTNAILFLLPTLWIRDHYELKHLYWLDVPLLFMASGGHLVYLVFGQVALKRSLKRVLLNTPRLLLLGIQLAFNNSQAAFEALRGLKSEFVRTPKSGEAESKILTSIKIEKTFTTKEKAISLYRAVPPKGVVFELLLALVFLMAFFWSMINAKWFMLPFLLLLTAGFIEAARHTLAARVRLRNG